jgi:hypothetical protein
MAGALNIMILWKIWPGVPYALVEQHIMEQRMEQFLHGTELVLFEAWLRVCIFTFVDISVKYKSCFTFNFTTRHSNRSKLSSQAGHVSSLIHYSGFALYPSSKTHVLNHLESIDTVMNERISNMIAAAEELAWI